MMRVRAQHAKMFHYEVVWVRIWEWANQESPRYKGYFELESLAHAWIFRNEVVTTATGDKLSNLWVELPAAPLGQPASPIF